MTAALWLDVLAAIAAIAVSWWLYREGYRRGWQRAHEVLQGQLPMPVICRICGGPDLWPAGLWWRQDNLGDDFDWGETPAARLKQVLGQARLEAVRLTPHGAVCERVKD